MTLREYVDSIRNKLVAVIGIGVSNTPLLELLLRRASASLPATSAAGSRWVSRRSIWNSWAVSCIWARTI
jgi:hypothetical protein